MTARLKILALCLLESLVAFSLQPPQSFQTIEGSTLERVAVIA